MPLLGRTKRFAVDVLRFGRTLPDEPACQVVGRELMAAAAALGAACRAASRASGRRACRARLAAAEEAADAAAYGLELLEGLGCHAPERRRLHAEACTLAALVGASRRVGLRPDA